MPEPKPIGFIPKWLRGELADEPEPMNGVVPDSDPRVVTRLVPKDHGYSLPAHTVSHVIELKQKLVYFAAFDVLQGPNPAREKVPKKEIRDAVTLMLEPAESGSFVIPARLLPHPRLREPDAVIARCAEMLASLDSDEEVIEVSIGALKVCQELGSLLAGEVESIEVTTYDRENTPRPTFTFTSASVERITRVLDNRDRPPVLVRPREERFRELPEEEPTSQPPDIAARETAIPQGLRSPKELTGQLEAIDLGRNEFQLRIEGHTNRVRGTAPASVLRSLRERLGEMVTLEGDVVRDAESLTIRAHRVVKGEDE